MEKKNIFLIDDDPDIHALLKVKFKDENVNFVGALDLDSGIQYLKNQAFDLLIIDIVLGKNISSDKVVAFLHNHQENEKNFNVPIVVISAYMYDEYSTRIKLKSENIVKTIKKPIDVDELKNFFHNLWPDIKKPKHQHESKIIVGGNNNVEDHKAIVSGDFDTNIDEKIQIQGEEDQEDDKQIVKGQQEQQDEKQVIHGEFDHQDETITLHDDLEEIEENIQVSGKKEEIREEIITVKDKHNNNEAPSASETIIIPKKKGKLKTTNMDVWEIKELEIEEKEKDVNIRFERDINDRNQNGETPLMVYSYKGDSANVKKAINSGAGVNLRSKRGMNALHYAVHGDDTKTIEILLINNCKLNCQDENKAEPFAHAVMYGSLKVIKYLIKQDAKLNRRVNGKTYLMLALDRGDPKILSCLLKAGINPHIRSVSGRTVFDIAKKRKQFDLLKILEDHIKKLNETKKKKK